MTSDLIPVVRRRASLQVQAARIADRRRRFSTVRSCFFLLVLRRLLHLADDLFIFDEPETDRRESIDLRDMLHTRTSALERYVPCFFFFFFSSRARNDSRILIVSNS